MGQLRALSERRNANELLFWGDLETKTVVPTYSIVILTNLASNAVRESNVLAHCYVVRMYVNILYRLPLSIIS